MSQPNQSTRKDITAAVHLALRDQSLEILDLVVLHERLLLVLVELLDAEVAVLDLGQTRFIFTAGQQTNG